MTLLNRGGSTLTIEAIALRSSSSEIVVARLAPTKPLPLASGARMGLAVPIQSSLSAGRVRVSVSYRLAGQRHEVVLRGKLRKPVTVDPSALNANQPNSVARLVSVKIGDLSGGKVRLRVELALRNPLAHALALAGVDVQLAISGNDFGKASAPALTLQPRERRRVTLVVVASRSTVGKTVRAMRGKRARFTILGALRLAAGKPIAFSSEAGAEVFGAPNFSGISRPKKRR